MSRGRIYRVKFINREMVREYTDRLFVFGDNLVGKGMGGQAYSMRGESNAVGIPTKKRPSMTSSAFFTDADLLDVTPIIVDRFRRLEAHLESGGDIVWPTDGIGTGRAELKERAPQIYDLIQRLANALQKGPDGGK